MQSDLGHMTWKTLLDAWPGTSVDLYTEVYAHLPKNLAPSDVSLASLLYESSAEQFWLIVCIMKQSKDWTMKTSGLVNQ